MCINAVNDHLPYIGGNLFQVTVPRLLVQIGFQVQGSAEINKGPLAVSEECTDFSNETGFVRVPKEYVPKTGHFLFRGLLVEDQKGNHVEGAFHFPLGLDKKLKGILSSIDKVSGKPLRIHQGEERYGPVLDCLLQDSGFERVGLLAVLQKIGKAEFQDSKQLGKR